ncbi:hypothetical protein TWF481_007553 [Arthrobotrys musiformis]|uniref:Uncharacterized protein n=1 Tax=Arthrobotrys musiformis TaxID=47236 RepID=A0AAV9WC27_9PEZI
MQLLLPAIILGSLIQSSAAYGYDDRGNDRGNNGGKVRTVTQTKLITQVKQVKVTKTVISSVTVARPPSLKDIESYASYKGLTCIAKVSGKPNTTKAPTTTEVEPAWVKNCPASVTLTAQVKCPAIRCVADPECPAYDQALPIEWECRCKDRPPTTTRIVPPCPSCCPPPPRQTHAGVCMGRMSHLPVFTAEPVADEPKPTNKGIAVGEPNPAAPKEEFKEDDSEKPDQKPKEEEPEKPKEEEPEKPKEEEPEKPKEEEPEKPKEDEPEQPKEEEPAGDQLPPAEEGDKESPAELKIKVQEPAEEKKDGGDDAPKEDPTEAAA